jgi:hypothetical protein
VNGGKAGPVADFAGQRATQVVKLNLWVLASDVMARTERHDVSVEVLGETRGSLESETPRTPRVLEMRVND